jgi:thiol-disulfide isomerase/thioredoxin
LYLPPDRFDYDEICLADSPISFLRSKLLIRFLVCGLLGTLALHAGEPVRAVLIPASERRPAEVIRLEDRSGRPLDLASRRGQVVLVDFWATWCGGCKEELPWFEHFDAQYRRKGFSVLAVSVDEDGWPVVNRFVDPMKLRMEIVLDGAGVAQRYGVKEMPAAFLIDRSGRVAATYVGLVERGNMESNIRALLSERRPTRGN